MWKLIGNIIGLAFVGYFLISAVVFFLTVHPATHDWSPNPGLIGWFFVTLIALLAGLVRRGWRKVRSFRDRGQEH